MREKEAKEVQAMLSLLYEQGIRLWIDQGKLCYRARRGKLLPSQLEFLKNRKSDILAALDKVGKSDRVLDFSRRGGYTSVPLSLQQDWFWNLMKKDRQWNYFVTSALRLRGELNVDALRTSLNMVVRRHESLRTRIVMLDGIPRQQIDSSDVGSLEMIKVVGASEEDACLAAQLRIETIFRRRIDTAVDPLFQRVLVRISGRDHVLVIAIHHMVTDAISFSHFFRELWAVYADSAAGRQVSLPEVAAQYADYTMWQRAIHLTARDIRAHYWNSRLAGASAIRWPVDPGLKDVERFTAATTTFSFGCELSSKLRRLAQRERVPTAMVVLAVICAFVNCWCEQKDFVIPFVFNGRQHIEHFDILGCFIHPLALRIELTGEETFVELIGIVSKEFATAVEYADLGASLIRRPDLAESAFVQCISWQPNELAGVPDVSAWGEFGQLLAVEPFPVKTQSPDDPRIDLGLATFFEDCTADIHAEVLYRADYFSAKTMEIILRAWIQLSEFATRDPSSPITSSPYNWERPIIIDDVIAR
jgi:Condensation domain/TubC N-terminal docking domain